MQRPITASAMVCVVQLFGNDAYTVLLILFSCLQKANQIRNFVIGMINIQIMVANNQSDSRILIFCYIGTISGNIEVYLVLQPVHQQITNE